MKIITHKGSSVEKTISVKPESQPSITPKKKAKKEKKVDYFTIEEDNTEE